MKDELKDTVRRIRAAGLEKAPPAPDLREAIRGALESGRITEPQAVLVVRWMQRKGMIR